MRGARRFGLVVALVALVAVTYGPRSAMARPNACGPGGPSECVGLIPGTFVADEVCQGNLAVCVQVGGPGECILQCYDGPLFSSEKKPNKCQVGLAKQVRKLIAARIKCGMSSAKSALKGTPLDASPCRAKARSKYDVAVAKLSAKLPDCPESSVDAVKVGDEVETYADLMEGAVYSAPCGKLPQVPPGNCIGSCNQTADLVDASELVFCQPSGPSDCICGNLPVK